MVAIEEETTRVAIVGVDTSGKEIGDAETFGVDATQLETVHVETIATSSECHVRRIGLFIA